MELKVIEELRSYITPLSREELFTLKESISIEGCREPLVVWNKSEHEQILIDGHNRFAICNLMDVPFQTRSLNFKNFDEVKDWMVDNQLGRRNLNPDQLSYYRGLKYERLKKKKGGYDKILSKGHSGPLTSEILAEEFNVSEKTIKRDSLFSRGIDLVGLKNPELKVQILSREAKVKKSDVQLLAKVSQPPNRKYKNIADLQNEISRVRKNNLNEKEQARLQEKEVRLLAAQEALLDKDALFKTREEQIVRAKARIVSQLNKCIKEKNTKSFKELDQIIDQLKVLILVK